jgi:TolB-like protein
VAVHKPGFFEELKRRHVWRVAIAYAVVAWLLLQLLSIVFPTFGAPAWVLKVVTVLLAAGLPVALVLAWAFEVTPEGVRRTEPVGSPQSRPEDQSHRIGRTLNTAIIVALILAVGLLGWRLMVLRHAPAAPSLVASATRSPDAAKRNPGISSKAAPGSAAGAAASGLQADAVPVPAVSIPEKSVAVLPFVNESGAKDQRFFSDGLSEDLITALSQFAGLKVISRNSAFQFRDSKDSSSEIGKLLGVAHLLEGSVQRAGDEVRITATLVNAADGSVLWTQRYDKPYKDLFALQDAITTAVASALKAKLLTAPGAVVQSDRPPSGNLAAYTAFLRGIALNASATEVDERKAIDAFALAIKLDPKYARAYAAQGRAWAGLGAIFLGGAAHERAYDKARNAIGRALHVAPDLAAGYAARSYLEAYGEFDWQSALADAQRAVQLAPDDSDAQLQLGGILAALGQVDRAVNLTRQALKADPRNGGAYFNLSWFFASLGQFENAEQAIRTAIEVQPQGAANHEQLAVVAILSGDTSVALTAAHKETSLPWRESALALALQNSPDRAAADAALKTLTAAQGSAYQVAEVYALRHDPDNMFQWLDRAWNNRDGGLGYLLSDPFILRYRYDPRFAAFCEKVGLPTTTDAVAMKL